MTILSAVCLGIVLSALTFTAEFLSGVSFWPALGHAWLTGALVFVGVLVVVTVRKQVLVKP